MGTADGGFICRFHVYTSICAEMQWSCYSLASRLFPAVQNGSVLATGITRDADAYSDLELVECLFTERVYNAASRTAYFNSDISSPAEINFMDSVTDS